MDTVLIPTDLAINVSPDGTVTAWESFGDQLRSTVLGVAG